jgi:hypothetical protein
MLRRNLRMVTFIANKPGSRLLIQQLFPGVFNLFFNVVRVWHSLLYLKCRQLAVSDNP